MEASSQISGFLSTVLPILAALALGACMGSFVNAAAMRTVAERRWWGLERSTCDHCGETLRKRDLVPVVSYLLLGGRCRGCGGRIAPRHLWAELVSAALTAGLCLRWGVSPALGMSLAVLWFSLFNALTDLGSGFIYDVWALALGAAGLAIRAAGGAAALLDGAIGGAVCFGVIALIILASRGGMGWGDAMLMLGIGTAVGARYGVIVLYLGFFCAGLGLLPRAFGGRLKLKDAIPLGPYLAAGALLTLFVGDACLQKFAPFLGSNPGWPWG